DDVPELELVVVAVDNALQEAKPGQIDTSTVESRNRDIGPADTGIGIAGLGVDGLIYVIRGCTVNAAPDARGNQVIDAIEEAWPGRMADKVVAEKNAGGNLIKRNLDVVLRDRGINPAKVPIYYVNAKDGKYTRAEPVHALYEQGRIKHVGHMPDLEFQMSR